MDGKFLQMRANEIRMAKSTTCMGFFLPNIGDRLRKQGEVREDEGPCHVSIPFDSQK